MHWWRRIVEAGIDDGLPRREARHVRALNMVAALFAVFAGLYVPIFLSYAGVGRFPAAISLGLAVGMGVAPMLNHLRRYDAARRLTIPVGVVSVTLIALCCGRDSMLHYYFLGIGFPFAIFPRSRARALAVHVASLIVAFYLVEALATTPWLPVPPEMTALLRTSVLIGLVLFLLLIAFNAYLSLIRADEEVEAAHAVSERLLANILPPPIAARMKAGATTIADTVPAATILFADIVDFTRYAQRVSAVELVRMLDEIFSRFDALLPLYGLEKIKTIGDAYMAASGLLVQHPDHAARAADMALAMQALMRGEIRARYPDLQLRIGMHSGPMVAGVIGQTKFAYDVWGESVNAASRMESHGTPDRIQVGRGLRDTLDRSHTFEPRGAREVKGLGTLELFFLIGRRDSSA